MKKGNWPGRMTDEQSSPLTTRERWTIKATADSTQLDLESLCKLSSILYCRGAMRAITNSCCLLPVSYSGVYFPLGYLAYSYLSFRNFGMKHKASMASQRHSSGRLHWWRKCVTKFHRLKRCTHLIRRMTWINHSLNSADIQFSALATYYKTASSTEIFHLRRRNKRRGNDLLHRTDKEILPKGKELWGSIRMLFHKSANRLS